MAKAVPKQTLKRLPMYLDYLQALTADGPAHISASSIAAALDKNDVLVRKDLASVSEGGRPKIGYVTAELIADIKDCLGYNNTSNAIIAGAGNIGRALLAYDGFAQCGLDIVAAFDTASTITGETIAGKPVLHPDKLPGLCRRMNIRLGVIAVPASGAQAVCDLLIQNGILAIWNFAPTHLTVPAHVLVQNENMACSLALLSKHLSERLKQSV